VQYDDTPGSLSVTYSRTVNSGATILGTSYPAANLTKVALADGWAG